jgi:hypothetical protein
MDAVSRSESNEASRTTTQAKFDASHEVYNHKVIDEEMLEYTALSYTWGAEAPTYDILVDNQDRQGWLSIRQNLYDFLKIRRDTSDVTPWFWIDQICIDQGNDVEKGHQVNQMSDIYKTATNVEVWFSPAFEGSDELMDILALGGRFDDLKMRRMFKVKRGARRRTTVLRIGFARIWNMPYWSRLWIIQEVCLNETVIVRLGHKTLPWSNFCNGVCKVMLSFSTRMRIEIRYFINPEYERRRSIGNDEVRSPSDWYNISWLVQNTQCFDPRDRAYGVMGLMPEALRFYPDYSLSAQQVLLKLIRVQATMIFAQSSVVNRTRSCLECSAEWYYLLASPNHPIDSKMVRRFLVEEILPLVQPDIRTTSTWWWKFHIWRYLSNRNS